MPHSRLAYPTFLPRPRTSRFPSFRMPLLAPLLASALAAMSACASGPSASSAPTENATPRAPTIGDSAPGAVPDRQANDSLERVVDSPAKP